MKKLVSSIILACLLATMITQSAFALDWDKRNDFVNAARNEVGTSYDMDGGSDYHIRDETKYGRWFAEADWGRYLTHYNYYSHEAPWCVMFIGYCANQAGISQDDIPWYSDVESMYWWYVERGRYQMVGQYNPQPGDIAFLKLNGEWRHVAIVTGYSEVADPPFSQSAHMVYTVDGDVCVKDSYGNLISCYVGELSYKVRLADVDLYGNGKATIVGYGVN